MSTRPRRYRQDSIDWGDVLCYLLVAFALMFLVGHIIVSIGNGVLP